MRDRRLLAGLTGAGLAYAIVRYNVFKGVPWDQLPIYVANKAIAFVGLVMLGLSRVVVEKNRRKNLGLTGALLVAVHVLLSLILAWPKYYESFYAATGQMTLSAELSMLAGALGTGGLLWLFYVTTVRPVAGQTHRTSLVPGLGRAVLLFTAIHVALIGMRGWFDFASWPGSLPPITLLSFALAAALGFMPKARRKPSPAETNDPPPRP